MREMGATATRNAGDTKAKQLYNSNPRGRRNYTKKYVRSYLAKSSRVQRVSSEFVTLVGQTSHRARVGGRSHSRRFRKPKRVAEAGTTITPSGVAVS